VSWEIGKIGQRLRGCKEVYYEGRKSGEVEYIELFSVLFFSPTRPSFHLSFPLSSRMM
jgi:hypothetical protein